MVPLRLSHWLTQRTGAAGDSLPARAAKLSPRRDAGEHMKCSIENAARVRAGDQPCMTARALSTTLTAKAFRRQATERDIAETPPQLFGGAEHPGILIRKSRLDPQRAAQHGADAAQHLILRTRSQLGRHPVSRWPQAWTDSSRESRRRKAARTAAIPESRFRRALRACRRDRRSERMRGRRGFDQP